MFTKPKNVALVVVRDDDHCDVDWWWWWGVRRAQYGEFHSIDIITGKYLSMKMHMHIHIS